MNYYIDYNEDNGQILGFLIKEDNKKGTTIEVSKDIFNEGHKFNKIIIDGENISFEKVDFRTNLEVLIATKIKLESAIDNKIQSEIDTYNEANGTTYKNIDAIPKYLYNPDYTHYTFCLAVTDWNLQVWEKARSILADVENGLRAIPTEAELLAELPIL